MKYKNKFKKMIAAKDKLVFRPLNQNQCNIYFANDDVMGIEQEVYYEFDDFGNRYDIYIIIRGNKKQIASFNNGKYAYLYMGLMINDSLKSEMNPIPEEIEELDDEDESNYEELELLISKYIDPSLFSVFELKNNSICLTKENGRYTISFVDWRGNKNIMSRNRECFGIGLQVVCNYAWTYQYVLEQVKGWHVNPDDDEYLFIIKKLLGL